MHETKNKAAVNSDNAQIKIFFINAINVIELID